MTQEKYVCTLSKELQEVAKNELNEDPEKRDKDIQALRERVIANKALKCPTNGDFLVRFLRARKYDLQKSYDLLINYYTVRAKNSHFFDPLLPSQAKTVIDTGILTIFPSTDKLGRSILYIRPGKWDTDQIEMLAFLKVNLLSLEQMIRREEHQVKGLVVIMDLADVGLKHLWNTNSDFHKVNSEITQNAFPMRLKGTHFINEPTIFGYLYAIVKPFLSEKVRSRQHFHGSSLESLQEHFDVSSLPEELGGSLGPGDLLADAWKKELYSNEEYFKDLLKYKIELAKEIFKKSNNPSDVSTPELAGTFKKLNID